MVKHSHKFFFKKLFFNKRNLVYLLLIPFLFSCKPKEEKVINTDDNLKIKCYNLLFDELKKDENFWVSIHAAEALTLAGKTEEVKKILDEKLKKEEDGRRICGIAREFVRAGDKSKVELLLKILKDEKYTYAHVHACESLYKINEVGDGKLLLKAMNQKENVNKRIYAAAALGRSGNYEAMKIIREYLISDDSVISARAAWILARIGDESDIPNLKKALKKFETEKSAYEFENGLAMLGDKDGLNYLLKNLRSSNPVIKEEAIVFIGEIGATNYKDELLTFLDDTNVGVRIRTAQVLLQIL